MLLDDIDGVGDWGISSPQWQGWGAVPGPMLGNSLLPSLERGEVLGLNSRKHTKSASCPLLGFGESYNNTITDLTSFLSVEQDIDCTIWNWESNINKTSWLKAQRLANKYDVPYVIDIVKNGKLKYVKELRDMDLWIYAIALCCHIYFCYGMSLI